MNKIKRTLLKAFTQGVTLNQTEYDELLEELNDFERLSDTVKIKHSHLITLAYATLDAYECQSCKCDEILDGFVYCPQCGCKIGWPEIRWP